MKRLEAKPKTSNDLMMPIAGQIRHALGLSVGDYLALVDRTGRQLHPGKRGVITGPLPTYLRQLGFNDDNWTRQVHGIRSAYPRAVGVAEMLLDKAKEIGQRWLRGIALARKLKLRPA